MVNNQLEQLALLLSNGAPSTQTQPLYNQLQAGGQVPLDHPTMLQANPALAATLLLPQLEQQLNAGNTAGAQELYNLLAQGGEVPLDHPTMLRANMPLAQLLSQTLTINPEQAWEMTPQATAPEQSFLDKLSSYLPSAQDVQSFVMSPEKQGKAISSAVAWPVKTAYKTAANLPQTLTEIGQDPAVRDTLGAFLYGMFGDSLMPSPQPVSQAPAAAPVQQAPEAVPAQTYANAPAQAQPVQPSKPIAQQAAQPQDVVAALTGQVPTQAGVATPEDIVGALTGQPEVQGRASAPMQSQSSWYARPEFLTYLGDVLNGVAANDNWAKGIAQGNMYNEQRGVVAQKTAQEQMLLQAQLAKMLSETQKNTVDAKVAGINANRENDPNSLDNQKKMAEILRINAEKTLAEIRAKYVGQERVFSDADYTRAYSDVLKSEQEAYMMDPENPAYIFGPDFSARYKLNTISPNVARYYPMDGKTKQLLDSSWQQLQSGEITKEEFDSRLYQVQYVHGPESIQKYISGASNATTKPK